MSATASTPSTSYAGIRDCISTIEHDANPTDHAYHIPPDVEEQIASDCLQHHSYSRQACNEVKSTPTRTSASSKKRQASCALPEYSNKKRRNSQSKPHSQLAFKPTCIRYLQMSKYKQALNEMKNSKNRFLKKALVELFSRLVREEIAAFVKSPHHSVFGQPFSFENSSGTT